MDGVKGMWQVGEEDARVTLLDADGGLLYEAAMPAEDRSTFEPPEQYREAWDSADWTVVDFDEPEVRKVITCFIVELGLDGNVTLRSDFSARYDLLRPATPSDMLTCLGRGLEELRADMLSHMVAQRLDEQRAERQQQALVRASGNGGGGARAGGGPRHRS